MKVRELIPMLIDRISRFIVCDSLSGDLVYDDSTHEQMEYDVGNADIRSVYFEECEGEFPNTTNTICIMTIPYDKAINPDIR